MTTHKIKSFKANKKITMLTCYDFQTATILDQCGVDMILVGDSLGNVVLGHQSTTAVTIEDILHHTRAVARGAKNSLIVGDMPFMSYHIGKEKAVENAGKIIQAGAAAVKVEGGTEILEQVKAIISCGIPVMGHIGLQPQSVNLDGGYFVKGRNDNEVQKLLNDAKVLEQAGVFAIVIECAKADIAEEITKNSSVPTIGIGAGVNCDGQVLVINDMLGMSDTKTASFVKKYANLNETIKTAVNTYIKEVEGEAFPSEEYWFN